MDALSKAANKNKDLLNLQKPKAEKRTRKVSPEATNFQKGMSLYMEHAIDSIENAVPVKSAKPDNSESYFRSSTKDAKKLRSSSRVFNKERASV